MPSELSIISSMATRQILAELADVFTADTGRKINLISIGGIDAAKRVSAGEALDVAVLALDALKKLEGGGHIVAGSIAGIARSPTAIAVKEGTRAPRVADERSLRELIAKSRTVGLSTGPSGVQLLHIIKGWNLGAEVLARIVQAPPGVPVARLVAKGEAEIGFQQLSELIGEPGITVGGTLPETVLPMTVFAAGVCSTAPDAPGAGALVGFLRSAATEAIKVRHGMEPA